jgi:hypothetical protein
MGANFSKIETVVSGETITASERNAEFDNILNNFTPAGMDDYSVNTTQMQATSDPYPGAVESLATSLAGELERIRFVIKQITGKAQWYIDPTNDSFASGTALIFYQASAPTGWTAVSVNDKFLRVVTSGGTGGTAGGSGLAPSSTVTLAHSHTVSSHTHTMANHKHAIPLADDGGGGGMTLTPRFSSSTSWGTVTFNPGTIYDTNTRSSGGTLGSAEFALSNVPDNNTTDAASPGTDSQLSNTAFQYADVIVATKN